MMTSSLSTVCWLINKLCLIKKFKAVQELDLKLVWAEKKFVHLDKVEVLGKDRALGQREFQLKRNN